MTRKDRRIRIRVLLALGVLLPGFPLLMFVIGWPLSMIGLSGPVFMAALTMHNLYYSLPASVFGRTYFPAEEFGGEKRFVTIGMDGFGRLLVVAYTCRDENIRIISARKATRSEVRQYESEL